MNDEQFGTNADFIQGRCQLCGGEDVAGLALSEIELRCGYGANNDMSCVHLKLCGRCADAIFILLGGETVNERNTKKQEERL